MSHDLRCYTANRKQEVAPFCVSLVEQVSVAIWNVSLVTGTTPE